MPPSSSPEPSLHDNSPPPRVSMNDLPVELRQKIVKLCKEQDDKFKEWAKTQSASVLKEMKKMRAASYGRSVAMLFQVDKQFSVLAVPYLFEVLKSSKVDLTFKFSKLVLRKDALESLYGHYQVTSFTNLSQWYGALSPTYAALGFRALKDVQEIDSGTLDVGALSPFVQNNDSLRTLHLRFATLPYGTATGSVLSQAHNLQILSLTADDNFPHQPFDLSATTGAMTTPLSLKSLSITAQFLHSSHLSFAASFATSLEKLSLRSTYPYGEEEGYVDQRKFQDDQVFPHVTSLAISGHKELISTAVLSIDAGKHFPSLTRLELEVYEDRRWGDGTSFLAPFRSSLHLRTLSVPNTSNLDDAALDDLSSFCLEHGVTLEHSPTGLGAIMTPVTVAAVDPRPHNSRLAGSIERTVEYVLEEAKAANERTTSGR